MKNKKVMVAAFVAFLLILGSAAAAWHNNTAFAKSKVQTPEVNQKAIMAKYSPPNSKNKTATSGTHIRKSRLAQMNVVGEAAQALNVLPINIIDEMKKGKTLVQIAKDKGLTKAQFMQKLTDVENKTVDAAVKSGTITQKHADAIKQGQKDRLTKSLDLKSVNVKDHQAMDMGN
jgi:hypothetical protein